jgi:magnesium transporter
MLRNPLLIPDLREMLQGGETEALREFFQDHHPAAIVEVLEDLEPAEADAIYTLLEDRQRADLLSYFDQDKQIAVIESLAPQAAGELLRLMPHDDRADLVNRLDEEQADEILRHLAHAEREDIRRLLSYEGGTAGSVMTTDYATLPPHLTVREAIEQLRREAPDRETIYTSYVIDHRRKLLGSVPLQRLILARPSARVEDVMQHDPITVRSDDDQEAVARTIQQYDLIAIPVLDNEERLVGIITHDDAMDILRQEQTEDILKFGGVSADPEADFAPYWQSDVLSVVKRRIKWLLLLFLAENLTYPVFKYFGWLEGDHYFPALNYFVTLLIGTGGNAGSQTVGTVIRGVALGEIEWSDAWRVLLKEWLTGLAIGVILGSFGLFYAHFYRGQPWPIAFVVGLTLFGICQWANIIGSMVPLLAVRVGIDPAVVSAPFISTLVDATGLFLYYLIALVLLLHMGWGQLP